MHWANVTRRSRDFACSLERLRSLLFRGLLAHSLGSETVFAAALALLVPSVRQLLTTRPGSLVDPKFGHHFTTPYPSRIEWKPQSLGIATPTYEVAPP